MEHKGQPVVCSAGCASCGSDECERNLFKKAGLHACVCVFTQSAEGCLHALPFFVSTRQEISFSNTVRCRQTASCTKSPMQRTGMGNCSYTAENCCAPGRLTALARSLGPGSEVAQNKRKEASHI